MGEFAQQANRNWSFRRMLFQASFSTSVGAKARSSHQTVDRSWSGNNYPEALAHIIAQLQAVSGTYKTVYHKPENGKLSRSLLVPGKTNS